MNTYLLVGGPANGIKLSVKAGVSILYRDVASGKDFEYRLADFYYGDQLFKVALFNASDVDIVQAIKTHLLA